MPGPSVTCLPNGSFAENCYIVADPVSREAAIIDPGEESGLFLRRLAADNLTPRAVWVTHGHIDHILGVGDVVLETGVPVFLHPADRALYDAAPQQGSWLGIQASVPPPPDHGFKDGDTVAIGRFAFTVRHVPGHSPGSVALIGHGMAFVGDVLFADSVGRVDLPGGDGAALLRSIQEVLLTLPDETIVYPGHGPETTIGRERRSNPFLNGVARLA